MSKVITELSVTDWPVCPHCQGELEESVCEYCCGEGWVYDEEEIETDCGYCQGEGAVYICQNCNDAPKVEL
jgi:DnaJ-class molecular chaperone